MDFDTRFLTFDMFLGLPLRSWSTGKGHGAYVPGAFIPSPFDPPLPPRSVSPRDKDYLDLPLQSPLIDHTNDARSVIFG